MIYLKTQICYLFTGLIVSPTAQNTAVKIQVKNEYLIRSFKDGRYYTVPKKETQEFTRDIANRVENASLKTGKSNFPPSL